jgi:peptidoglycan/xylan/chitin deacetylase (PgdA/CDA1 family)
MLKRLKQATLASLKTSTAFTLVNNSRWRRQRLLILAYHGISLDDEHLWNSSEFMPKEMFRARLSLIKKSGCTVLTLAEAVQRLYAGDLPEKSVVITFDDGTYDFYHQAFPLLREFDFPATLYLTTFYCDFNRPVFDVACSYLLWKGQAASLNLKQFDDEDLTLNLSAGRARKEALESIQSFVLERKLSAEQKDDLLTSLAKQLEVNYEAVVEKRILHLLNRDEVKQLAEDGIDVQLHTHRHRVPMTRELFLREIEDNRSSIQQMTGQSPSHFCYPSGVWNLAFLPWLREAGIESATTCELGLASPRSDPFLLPRLIDVSGLSSIEFEGWLTGIAAALPRR